MFWVLLAVIAFTFIVSPLLAPKPKGLNANLNEVSPPTAQKGVPVPVIFGTQKIAPNVTWWGNVRTEPIKTITGNRTLLNPFAVNHSTTTGFRYGADISGVICHGPIDEIVDFVFQDVSMKFYTALNANYVIGPGGTPVLHTAMTPSLPTTVPVGNGPTIYTLKAPDLFGGDSAEGGVTGTVEWWWGKRTQDNSSTLAGLVGEPVSNYKGIVHFIMYNGSFGTSPYLKPFYAIVRRCPFVISPDAATANINGSANAAEVIYEVWTNAQWGLGKSAAMLDLDSFAAAAVTLKAEGMGVDGTWNAQDAAESLIGELLRHIDGVMFPHPETGLITLKLARADYDVGTLFHVNKSNCVKFANFKRSTWPETYNEVKINYVARGVTLAAASFVQDTVQAQNLASLQAMGDIASMTLDFPYFSSGEIALKTAFRTLRVVSSPLASGTMTVNRKLSRLTVGSVFVLDWEPLGITGMVMRVMNMKFGTLDENTVDVDVMEDVFNTAPVVFIAPPPTSWTPPTTVPTAHLRAAAIPAMYYLTRADQFIGLNMVVRGSGSSVSWDGTYTDVPTTPDTPVSGVMVTTGAHFTPAGTLVALYPYTTAYQDETGFLVQDINSDMSTIIASDADGLARGDNLAWIASADGGEIIAWRDIIPQATPGQYRINGVRRGQFDTVPMDHKLGVTIYFFLPLGYQPYYPGMDTSSTPPTATAQSSAGAGYKFWPAIRGITSSLPPAPPTGVIKHPALNTPSLDPQRAVMPLPVGDTQLLGVKNNAINPATTMPDTATVSWVHRNRFLQSSTLLHDDADMTIEAAETYEIDVQHVSKTTGADIFGLLRTITPAVSPTDYTNHDFEDDITSANGGIAVGALDTRRTDGGIRFLVRSVRAGLKSYDVAIPGFRRNQQTGYPIIPSLQFTNIFSGAAGMDLVNLGAWYEADDLTNVVSGGNQIDTFTDLSGNGNHLTRTVGTPILVPNDINGARGGSYMNNARYSDLVIPAEGSLTYFAVIYANAASIYNIFDNIPVNNPPIMLWCDGGYYPAAIGTPIGGFSGQWIRVVLHLYNVFGTINYKMRVNGVQVGTGSSPITGLPVPGSVGTPANVTVTSFHRGGANLFVGRIGAFGWYTQSKDGTEAALETYLHDAFGF